MPQSEWLMYKDETGETVPQLVSEELWEKCNAIFSERSKAIKSRERSFKDSSVFTGKIWCSADDKPYWRTSYSNSVSKGEPVYQWICSEKRKNGAKSCSSFAIMESELYKILSDYFKDVAGNIEDYVESFLRIYSEADINSGTQKQINDMKIRMEREKQKREKLLELYLDGAIEKPEFTERNDSSNILISQLEEDIYSLETKSTQTSDYLHEIRRIERYFKDMYRPDGDMTKEQVDEMAKAIIDGQMSK